MREQRLDLYVALCNSCRMVTAEIQQNIQKGEELTERVCLRLALWWRN